MFKKEKKKTTKIIFYAIVIIIVYNLLIVAVSAALNKTGKTIFGFKVYIVSSNSMEPNIKKGDVIIIKNTKEENLEVGEVITFKRNDGIVTHRIIEIIITEDGQKEYITKGDNNNIEDVNTVTFSEIEGTKVLKIPCLGKLAEILQNEVYFILIIIIVLLIILHIQRTKEKEILRRKKKKEEDENFENKKNYKKNT